MSSRSNFEWPYPHRPRHNKVSLHLASVFNTSMVTIRDSNTILVQLNHCLYSESNDPYKKTKKIVRKRYHLFVFKICKIEWQLWNLRCMQLQWNELHYFLVQVHERFCTCQIIMKTVRYRYHLFVFENIKCGMIMKLTLHAPMMKDTSGDMFNSQVTYE